MRSTQTKKAICLRKARFSPCLPFIYRFFSLPNRAENLRYQNWTNKNSCRSSAKLSAWCWRVSHASGIFRSPNSVWISSFRVIARSNEGCDVAIYRSEMRLSAGFPRSLRSLGMTRVGTPTPDCHVERSRNISRKGNDVNCRKIVYLVLRLWRKRYYFTKGTRLRAFHYVLAWDNATQ